MRLFIAALWIVLSLAVMTALVVRYYPGGDWSQLQTLVVAFVVAFTGVAAFEAIMHLHTPRHRH